MADTLDEIVDLSISLIVVGVLFPIALPYVITASFGTSTLATTMASLFSSLITVVAIVVIVLLFLKYRKAA
jgi:hypothetical protein